MTYDPNTPYQQPQSPSQGGYQQPGYPPSGGQQPVVVGSPLVAQLGPSSIGLDANLAGALSYFWVIGLIFFLIEKKNRFVRFHAFQALAYGVALIIVGIALNILSHYFFLLGCAGGLLELVWFVGAVYAAVQAYNGKWFQLPVVGDLALKNATAWIPPEAGQ